MIKLCEPVIIESEPEPIEEIILSDDLIKCYHCDLEIKLDEKSVRKNDFWFHQKCFEKIPIVKTEESVPIVEKPPKIIREPIVVRQKASYPQMVYSAGLLASLTGTTYFLAGDVIAYVVGVCGTALYFATFKSQFTPKRKADASIVKTGILGFDSTLSVGLKKIVQWLFQDLQEVVKQYLDYSSFIREQKNMMSQEYSYHYPKASMK